MTHRTVLQIWPIKVDAVMRHDVKGLFTVDGVGGGASVTG